MKIILGGEKRISLTDIEFVARRGTAVSLGAAAARAMERSRKAFEKNIARQTPIYGVTTQFGGDIGMMDGRGSGKEHLFDLRRRQTNLINSHNCGLGESVAEDAVRAAMLLRAVSLGRGFSGARTEVAAALLKFLNKKITPVVRRYGSVGASGDLIPLSAIASALGGGGECSYKGKIYQAGELLRKLKIKPLELEAKEGLALVNGTSFMTAIASLSAHDVKRLFLPMLSGLALSLEALLGIKGAYSPFIHKAKGHKGQMRVNDFFNNFWKGSRLIQESDFQDYYSLRSIPQGFGPFYENIEKTVEWIEREANSCNDNPLVAAGSSKIYNGANFMGYYITEACDILKIDIAQASSWIHAIIANLIHPRKNKGLPANLIENPEKNVGMKALQILAASLAVQNRKLALPNQAVMIPTEGDNQDVNSLGAHAAYDLMESCENLERLTGILLIAAAQALELRGVGRAGEKAKKIHRIIRSKVSFLKNDRPLASDIESAIGLIKSGALD